MEVHAPASARRQRMACLFLAAFLVAVAPAAAQTVNGRVTDAGGRPIPGAEVVAADSATGEVKRATTDGDGAFRFRFDEGTAVVALAAQAAGYAPSLTPRLRLLESDDEPITLKLSRLAAGDARRVAGRVGEADGFEAIREAFVSLTLPSGRVVSDVTDMYGRFVLELPPDESIGELMVSALGFVAPPPTRILLPPDGAFLEIELPVDPVELEGLDVTVRPYESRLDRVGLTDRASQGGGRGRFLLEEDLERFVPAASGNTANLLRRVPGIWVSGGEVAFASASCAPTIWVDGLQVAGQGSTRSFSQVAPPPEDIEGIEVYRPFTMPAQFGGFGARCGAVVIWTKGG